LDIQKAVVHLDGPVLLVLVVTIQDVTVDKFPVVADQLLVLILDAKPAAATVVVWE
jgi:hypothetical protein